MAEHKSLIWIETVVIVGLLTVFLTITVTTVPAKKSTAHSIEAIRERNNKLFRHKRDSGGECLRELTAKGGGSTLTSPNYPENYPNNADCLWLITAEDPNATISLKIEDLNIEPHKDCRLDFLQVYLGATVEALALGPFCGNIYNRLIETNSSKILLEFHSDRMYQDKGFSIDYFTDRARDCLESVTEAFGSLRSPGFPDNYPDETDCTTLIDVPADRKVILNFDTVDLEVGDDCSFDYVQIFDGKTKNSTLLGQICQQTDVRSFESSASSLLVHFHSDNLVNKKGYRARYTSVDRRSTPIGDCQWEPGIDNGTISSPNYPENYPSASNCSIWILAPEGSAISINIEASLMEIDYNCSFDFLLISEGHSSASKVLGRFCGKPSEPRQINSTENEVLVHFQSDNFVEFSGFKLTYRYIKVMKGKSEMVRVSPNTFDGTLAFSVTPQNVTLSKGSSAMLHCATNHPEAKIRWLKGYFFLAGENPLPGLSMLPNNTLWIRGMHRRLVGVYTCVVVAPEGELATTAYVLMADEPSNNDSCDVEFRKAPSDSEFEEDGFAYLECRATGDRTIVSWEKDGAPLEMKEHVTNGFIVMDRIRLDDAGLYTCVATDGSCVKRASAVLKVVERVKIEEICGRSKVDLSSKRKLQNEHGKIVGGYDAPKGAYPWQVMLWEPKLKSFCGATLLNEWWIATAAHCFKNIKHNISWDSVRIFLGKHDREFRDAEEFETRIASPSAIVYHPKFVKYTFDNDLALVRMRDRVYFTDYIQPVCLGDRNTSEHLLGGRDPDRPRIGTVIGWGKLKENGPSPRYLQEIKLPLVDQELCRASTDFIVTRNMFCAGYSQEIIGDACYGDSGGPFLMSHEGRWYMVGIVSWGEGCGKQNKYGFYTRIANHLSWIQSVIKS